MQDAATRAPTGLAVHAGTAAAMVAFAANSVLARAALATGAADPVGYTAIRLVAGAAALSLLARRRTAVAAPGPAGDPIAAAALFAYALAFSLGYVRVGAATGALILFAAVQGGMIGWNVLRGARPSRRQTAGLAVAAVALVALLAPGLHAPDPLGAATMALSGAAWAVYTLRAGAGDPLRRTAANFRLAAPMAVAALLLPGVRIDVGAEGVLLAIASGALASGLGYAVWYAVLPALPRNTAAVVQLSVPAIAAVAGVVLLGEPLGLATLLPALAILGGVFLALRDPAAR
ncbi:DMT family transporter [Oharaeibacter diazotrophicus]|nr:DMT family transporter [Oharaeibacter diazotrophicus]